MFLPPEKAMHLRREVCRWSVAELFLSLRSINRGPRGTQCGKANKNGRRGSSVLCDITLICGCR